MGKKSMIIEEKTISSERIYEGRILNLRKDQVQVKLCQEATLQPQADC